MLIQAEQTHHQRTPSIYFKFDDQSHTRNLTKSSLMFDYSISNQKHIFMNQMVMNNKMKNNTNIKEQGNRNTINMINVEYGKEEYQCFEVNKLTPLGKYIQMKIDQDTDKKNNIKAGGMSKVNTLDINTNNIVNNNLLQQQQQYLQQHQNPQQSHPNQQTACHLIKKLPSRESITKKISRHNIRQQQDQFFKIYGSKNLLQHNHNKYSQGKIKTEEFFQEFQQNFIITFDQEDQIFVNQWSQSKQIYNNDNNQCNFNNQNEFQSKISKISKGNLNFQQFQPEQQMKFIQIQIKSKQNLHSIQNQQPSTELNIHKQLNNEINSQILNNSFQNININSNIIANSNKNNITELQKILNDKINFNSIINNKNNQKTTKKHIINPQMLHIINNQKSNQKNKENIHPNIIHNQNINTKNKNSKNNNNNKNINNNLISSTPDPLQFDQIISFGPIPSNNHQNKQTKKSKSTSNSNTNIHNPNNKKCFITREFENNSSLIIQKNPLIDTKRRVPIKNIQSLIIKYSKQRAQRTSSQLQTRHHKSNLINCQILTSTVNKSQKPSHCHTSNQNIWSNPIHTKKSFSLQNTFHYDNMFKTNGFKQTLKSTTLQNWKKSIIKIKKRQRRKKQLPRRKGMLIYLISCLLEGEQIRRQ